MSIHNAFREFQDKLGPQYHLETWGKLARIRYDTETTSYWPYSTDWYEQEFLTKVLTAVNISLTLASRTQDGTLLNYLENE